MVMIYRKMISSLDDIDLKQCLKTKAQSCRKSNQTKTGILYRNQVNCCKKCVVIPFEIYYAVVCKMNGGSNRNQV